jgi:hypothetical protein
MNSTVPRRRRAAFVAATMCLAALASLGFPGCPEDVTGPAGAASNQLTLSNCWPNDDGRYWLYVTTSRSLQPEPFEPLPADTPVPAITFGIARSLLDDEVLEWGDSRQVYGFRMQFEGLMTTSSGVTAQNLVESLDIIVMEGSGPGASFEARLLERIAAARPDLRARLGRPDAISAAPGLRWAWTPYFIHGYAWSKTPERIGTFGDVDTLLAWKFLDANVRPGATFRHQLVPSLASDVWLSAIVERTVALHLPDGSRSASAIDVLYVLDYGTSYATDAMGIPIGAYRTFDYGRVTYAPGVGPVRDLERRLAYLGDGVTHGVHELELNLQDTGIAAPALLAGARGAQ